MDLCRFGVVRRSHIISTHRFYFGGYSALVRKKNSQDFEILGLKLSSCIHMAVSSLAWWHVEQSMRQSELRYQLLCLYLA